MHVSDYYTDKGKEFQNDRIIFFFTKIVYSQKSSSWPFEIEILQKDGNLYHKNGIAENPTWVEQFNLVEAEYLFNKHCLKKPAPKVSNYFQPIFTAFEDQLLRKANEFDMVSSAILE